MDKLQDVTESKKSLTESSQNSEEKKAHATRCATILLGCYRSGDANDPEIYVSSVVAMFCAYPVDVMERVVNPVTGLPARSQWLPTLAEVRSACEEIYGPMKWASEWDKRAQRQLEERAQIEADRSSRLNYDELRAKYPEAWVSEIPNPFDVDAFRRKHGISQEQWDAIPNA